MGTVYKKTVTRPVPAGAETIVRKGERFAVWKDAKGKARKARLTVGKHGGNRLAVETPYFTANYRDGAGIVREVATGCRDETAARQVLADLERKAELVRSGVMTSAEEQVGRHQSTPMKDHFDAYNRHLTAKGASAIHRSYTRRYLNRLATECAFWNLGRSSARKVGKLACSPGRRRCRSQGSEPLSRGAGCILQLVNGNRPACQKSF